MRPSHAKGAGLLTGTPDGPLEHGADTQDFVRANANGSAVAINGLERGTPLLRAMEQAIGATRRVAEAALEAVGGSATSGLFGPAECNLLADAHLDQVALS